MTVTTTHPTPTDGNLPQAKRQLADAISNLIDPKPWVDNNTTHWLDSRYHQLRDALTAQRIGSSHKPASKPPAWIDAIDLLKDIDHQIHLWEPAWPIADCDDWPAVQRLRQVDLRKWRPQDTELINQIVAGLTRFAARIDQLFAAAPLYLPDKCPSCDHAKARRHDRDTGENINVPALEITTDGATCNNCHEKWPADRLVFLGRVLGYRISGLIET